ncbi:hypothetical protein OYT88_11920 [Sporolactobacillus sp. CQH2019]|uniref:hypothetical protein n=1 Tax=Sporolactobacillus sp. CQH2019 TaxID=3023512 RepID=UPI002368501F|nr:hypothetical protein [Sporolactobacillus sp. CQH2019]MDD9149261.1 hypothetical protein [Sporolactobacillus sp. CQH2019]
MKEQDTDDPLTTERYLVLCYKTGLSRLDLDDMEIGGALDYVEEYVDIFGNKQNNSEESVREAGQADFDSF